MHLIRSNTLIFSKQPRVQCSDINDADNYCIRLFTLQIYVRKGSMLLKQKQLTEIACSFLLESTV